ncbi:MAG: hypothetical protein K5905_17965 [Roseibium sp.]|uniref:hypothetical protein n=1 Tax=Roseibium sp. TaxID=1936156 RepID=UPI0026036167|nr:hypothetical protein [Roseibium sp.]MCV0427351.1 hypothetical protein [Roseibium sp.]
MFELQLDHASAGKHLETQFRAYGGAAYDSFDHQPIDALNIFVLPRFAMPLVTQLCTRGLSAIGTILVLTSSLIAQEVTNQRAKYEGTAALKSFLVRVRAEAIMQDAEVVDCTLSGGTVTKCMKLILKKEHSSESAPWCPTPLGETPDMAGIWIKDGKVFDAEGEFVKNLADLAADLLRNTYDPETGDVLASNSFDACFGVARPDLWKEYYYYCTQCTADQAIYSPIRTFFIPLNPVYLSKPTPLTNQRDAGVALSSRDFAGPAPLSAVLHAYNIAPFDDCGNQVNPYAGNQSHFVTECFESIESTAETDPHIN